MTNDSISLADVFEPRITGEWGTDSGQNDGIPVLRTTNFNNDGTLSYDEITFRHFDDFKKIENKFLSKGDILIEKSGGSDKQPVGRVVYFDGDNNAYLNNNFTAKLRNQKMEIIDTRYLFYFLRWVYTSGQVRRFQNKTTGLHNLQLESYLNSLSIPLIPMKEQKERAQKLDLINQIVENYRTQLSLIDKLVKSRFIETFGLPGTDPKCLGLESLDNLCIINPKKNADARLEDENLNISFIPMSSVSEDGTITNVETKTVRELKKGFTYFADNDVLFAKITPCMENGKGAIARDLENGIGFGSTEFHVLRPKDNCNAIWLYTLLSFPEFRTEATNHMTGSAGQRRVPAKYLASYRTVIPPISEQKLFAQFVENAEKSKFASIFKLQNRA